jgi:hypothetical protein
MVATLLLLATSVDVAAQQPSISVRDAVVVEGNSGTTQATFVVELSAASMQPVSFSFATSALPDATATAGSDYVATSGGPVTFDPGQTEKQVIVVVNGDTVDEQQETFFLDISGVQNATVSDSRGTGFINDDDGPTISINDASITEGNSGTTAATFTLTLSGPSVEAIAVRVVTRQGTATASSDYNSINLVVTFQPGTVTRTFDVGIIGDTNPELNETFFVDITEAFATTIADGEGLGTILNDDGPPPTGTLQFSSATYSQGEGGGTATITVTRTGGSLGAASVQFSNPAGGTATGGASCTAGVDYVTPSGTLNWADGDGTSKTFTVTICNDNTFEGNETVNLSLSNVTGATLGSQTTATLTINEDDAQPTISINDVSQSEGNSGTTNFSFTVSLSNPTTQTVTVNYASSNGTATTADNDYQAVGSTLLTFNPLETSKPVTLLVNGDTTFEPDETFFVNLSGASAATIADGQGQGTIVNDDVAPPSGTLQFSSATFSQGEGAGTATITVTRTGGSFGAASVQFSNPAGGTATGGASCTAGVDYITPSGTLNWGDGVTTSQTFSITICSDNIFEGNETVSLQLTNATGASLGSPNTATFTITDDETLQLILEESGPIANQAASLESLLFTRDPFRVEGIAEWFITPGQNTFVMVFARNLTLNPGETAADVIVNIVNNGSFDVPATDVRAVPNTDLTQIVFRLPDGLAPGTCNVTIRAHGQTSNTGTIRIAAP